ncbi:hypothetical protein Tsubulata_040772 [Turnera subulata]|uniref:Nudix hydrolase domain-containing protein n=1 Tax=Turnera subulata TaxID=218843 RepID=A0A9Q0FGJ9_9ROSI|nr:hypothetical protein Tsubulata_040772 [Turnera subulata]
MLKAIQILGSTSGFVAYLCKPPHAASTTGASFLRISTNPFSYSTSPTRPTKPFPLLSPKTRSLRPVLVHSSGSELSKMDTTPPPPPPPSAAIQSAGSVRKINFCQWCGGQTKHEIPDGEEKLRAICTLCGKITYQNPKMVRLFASFLICDLAFDCPVMEHIHGNVTVGLTIVMHVVFQVGFPMFPDNAINTRFALSVVSCCASDMLWDALLSMKTRTLPAGYLEIGESAAEGAIRETWEEARAEVEVVSPFAQLDIPLIGQTYVIFLAKLKKPHFSPGPESSECQLFSLEDIPFDSLAFSSMFVTLNLYIEDVKAGRLKFHYGTINKRPGTSPSDIRAFSLDYHLQS